jgi:hypothetical protein
MGLAAVLGESVTASLAKRRSPIVTIIDLRAGWRGPLRGILTIMPARGELSWPEPAFFVTDARKINDTI